MLSYCEGEKAFSTASEIVESKGFTKETLANAYYLRGNAYRQNSNVRMALNSYLQAMELDPDGPVAEAHRVISLQPVKVNIMTPIKATYNNFS